jgi:N-glycosylase/DNA lyase
MPTTSIDPSHLNHASVSSAELNVDLTLKSGQAFRWRSISDDTWIGAIDHLAVVIQPVEQGFLWQTYPENDCWDAIQRYFALDLNLTNAYAEWIKIEPRLEPMIRNWSGLRILRQPFHEAFFAFQCASCNTVVKITRSVTKLAERYGSRIDHPHNDPVYHFPNHGALANADETALRSDLWGFRAPRVIGLAREFVTRGDDWINGLHSADYAAAHAELAALPGIGAKVSDCICLFGLGMDEAVPIDTHVRRMVAELWRPDLAGNSLTPRVYQALGDEMRDRFGNHAGWVQQYLFLESMSRPIAERTKSAMK